MDDLSAAVPRTRRGGRLPAIVVIAVCVTTGMVAAFLEFHDPISYKHSLVPSTLNVVLENTTNPVEALFFHGKNGFKEIKRQGPSSKELYIDLANDSVRGIANPNTSHTTKLSSAVSTVIDLRVASGAMVSKTGTKKYPDANFSDHKHIAHFLTVIEALDQFGPISTSPASSRSIHLHTSRLAGENPAPRPAAAALHAPAKPAHRAKADSSVDVRKPPVRDVRDDNHAARPGPAAVHTASALGLAGAAPHPPTAGNRPAALRDFLRAIEEREAALPPPMVAPAVERASLPPRGPSVGDAP